MLAYSSDVIVVDLQRQTHACSMQTWAAVICKAWHMHVQVAVFDTAFHQSMPPRAFLYALPWEAYQQDGIRRYGAHGTSYRYLLQRAADMLQRKP